jgi:hypothetical protein
MVLDGVLAEPDVTWFGLARDVNPAFSRRPSTLTNGQYLQLRTTAPATYGTTGNAVMTVGTASGTWSVTTGAQMVTFLVGQQNNGDGYPCSGYPNSITSAVGSTVSIPLCCPDP